MYETAVVYPYVSTFSAGGRYMFVFMASSQRDWANDVRYYHGKGQAPRRSVQFPLFSMCVISLAVLTIAALIVEFS